LRACIACSLKQTFAQCTILFEGTLKARYLFTKISAYWCNQTHEAHREVLPKKREISRKTPALSTLAFIVLEAKCQETKCQETKCQETGKTFGSLHRKKFTTVE